jgi:tetratricopeptide (TPR) repeat protein
VQNDSAWYLLTMESESDRDPKAALDMALRAVKLTDFQNGLLLDTYALALYQVGNLDEAVKYQKIAVALEPANVELKRRLEELLDLQKKAGP